MRFLPRLMAGVPFVEPQSVQDRIKAGEEVLIIDVRTDKEFTSPPGHVPGAINLNGVELDKKLESAGDGLASLKSEPIFVMCRTENRAPRAARLLTKSGFTDVSIIKGGMTRWSKEGLPTEF